VFDARSGALTRLGPVPVTGPRLEVWRATTDNDRGPQWRPEEQLDRQWRRVGLHRLRHRLDGVDLTEDAVTVRTRVAPAGTSLGLRTVYRWCADADRLRLTVTVVPEGEWTVPLPRLGVRLGLPAGFGRARWFGGGPGEAYPDSCAASLVGVHAMDVDAMQTAYVRPQENGSRADVRRAELTDGGRTVRIEGEPVFRFAARRWTTEQLDAARHRPDLVAGDTVWVHLDHAQHGIGSASCGPGVLPEHRLAAAPAEFAFVLSAAGG
ncbi:beta-galactosidase small subunit, partial [Kitasatospora sp. NPDC001574]